MRSRLDAEARTRESVRERENESSVEERGRMKTGGRSGNG